jgi:ABC-type sugar transport system ATPase subunit
MTAYENLAYPLRVAGLDGRTLSNRVGEVADMLAEFKRLHRELGMTVLYATPDQLEALSMGERIAVLLDGRIAQIGTPDELYVRPKDTAVAAMVGAPRVNLVPLCTPGRPLRSLLTSAAVVMAVFAVVVMVALGSAYLYGVYLTG